MMIIRKKTGSGAVFVQISADFHPSNQSESKRRFRQPPVCACCDLDLPSPWVFSAFWLSIKEGRFLNQDKVRDMIERSIVTSFQAWMGCLASNNGDVLRVAGHIWSRDSQCFDFCFRGNDNHLSGRLSFFSGQKRQLNNAVTMSNSEVKVCSWPFHYLFHKYLGTQCGHSSRL